MTWKEAFGKGKELVLATCSKEAEPNANIVISLGFVDDKLLIANSQMETTIKNLKATENICIISGYYRLKGSVEIFDSGKYFDICNQADKEHPAKNTILITVKEVFDLDKVKKII